MSEALVFAFILLALLIGYLLGRYRSTATKNVKGTSGGWPQKRYYQGLNYLLNDQPDAAIDTFISALEVNSDTLETHLALGNLLRRRGETSKAIRVHQNLLARPSLSKEQLHLAQIELGVDFLKSGLLDRAESLFRELVEAKNVSKPLRAKALSYLLEVYQDEREWLQAIDVADQLTAKKFSGTPDQWREMQAHYCCELAGNMLLTKELLEARRWVRNALRYDKNCVRASLILAQIELTDLAPAQALIVLRKIPRQNPKFAPEALQLIYECFQQLQKPAERVVMFRDIYREHHSLPVLNYLVEAIAQAQGEDEVVDLLLQELPAFPQMEAAGELLKVVSENKSQWVGFNYNTVKGVLEKLTAARCQYECSNCGFRGEQLHWLCPSCKSWSSIAQR
ncbi:Lipopolysaccharide biosynthesis regulator YciM, contains six TPR domains and a predicted metal-binding C-terminal domain [Alteromonadaceae bacterium Bs31]|nr:Lipopolysaccharide biosynthesis regulator YciM, contains six TPR domains and a predicted metal-binding C-terminal domain [Alteromonadaceae bacterium Bs31]